MINWKMLELVLRLIKITLDVYDFMNKQSLRFIIVGILNTIVGFVVYALYLKYINNSYLQALILSNIVGITHSYIWNNNWTFTMKKFSLKSVVRFTSIYLISFLINLLFLRVLVDDMEMGKLFAQGISLFFTTLISFFGHKYWSFAKQR
ncbi:GtrA family protein [Paenibacillus sonchi]|uniref:GtrA family protein n=1 Tax=Paenibacillus sonchi TaxID=373687 RepID=UPI0038CDC944